MTSTNNNAPGGGRASLSKRAAVEGVIPKEAFFCGTDHISKLRAELHSVGLSLHDISGLTQRQTLLRVLQYLGPRGMNTLEGVGCSYYRIATRVHELEAEGWNIVTLRERVVGADGLPHNGIARYVLIGRKSDHQPVQGAFDLRGG